MPVKKSLKKTKGGDKKGKLGKLKTRLTATQFYCTRCKAPRKARSAANICGRITKNKRHQIVSDCSSCKNKVFKFVNEAEYNKYPKCK